MNGSKLKILGTNPNILSGNSSESFADILRHSSTKSIKSVDSYKASSIAEEMLIDIRSSERFGNALKTAFKKRKASTTS